MERTSQGRSAPQHGLAPGRQLKVLVVDDNAGFRESLLALLDTDDLLVVGEAASGAEALDLMLTVEPDVILMDVRMPTMDGIEATRRLKKLRPGVGIVALTANEDQEIVRDMLVAGASGFVLKDSDGEDILNAVIQAALGGAVLSPEVTPTVIDELTDALERERRKTQELEAAQRALVERSARRHELVSRLSHELRTPVTVIFGVAQTLARRTAEPDQESELIERLVTRAAGLARLVERFELAMNDGLTEHVDVAELARAVAADRERASVLAESGLPPARLNPHVATRILEEILDNALRFQADDASAEIRVGRCEDRLEVRVIDSGPGIDQADAERIFEPLEQVEELNVRTHQGVGLGLSLARTAAREMDGDIELESSGPEGSTFLWTIALDE